ncbi:metal ABC transporter ATP-binding protein [Anaeromicrobium sediminis]|uniref:ABC transporter n=1 Tax=Anaeromicrobium sediminis TaxID=1478221 RepID=A0A267MAC2_9FIRM|nr:metal ABC transporter ATP-binding protein [Anaeromicrobium sediminis]PAB56496.1 ABC transporter [Anaeromicrobium sediminis]
MTFIECSDLSFSYENKTVLSKVNFSVEKADYICILGENGSGKSTLVKGLLNLKRPSNGKIVFSKGIKSNEIGYLSQQKSMLKDFPASVFEVVLSGRLSSMGIRPFYTKKDKAIANKNIEKLGISHLKKKSFVELSGGQQQRVLLARGLCGTEKLLILDEPVTGLDPLVTLELYDLIKMINETEKMTIIMVTHDAREAIKHASHILHLANKQLFFGTTEEYKKTRMAEEFLGGGKVD